MLVRHSTYLAGVMAAAALGAGVVAAPAAHAEGRLHVVRAGQSVQEAVDAAADGDTVLVMPGTYRESVQITRNVTLMGAAPGQVTITAPADQGAGSAPAAPPKSTAAASGAPVNTTTSTTGADTGTAHTGKQTPAPAPAQSEQGTAVSGTTTQAACAAAGHGVCVTGAAGKPLTAVRIEALDVTGFRANGIDASGTDRMVVRHVLVQGNGAQGISQERSTRAVLSDNRAVDNGQSGIFVANLVSEEGGALDTEGTVISGNTLTGNRIGVTIRRARVLTVEDNTVSGNCGGVFVVGDENNPKAGDLDIRANRITENNKFCASNGRLPDIQGTGVLLTGAEDTRVTDNTISGNSGASPMSGGVVLFPSEVGVANVRDQVNGNTLTGNVPADIADRDTNGSGNTFSANSCAVSQPAGRC
ncbi:right-handed parallel beta-helix repeat-containing protein [Streptomyces sp. NRRL F-5123]|uniref:right-handed parallel beta-helix repeat-containing protein n=1 Tax=Streptomyces sp. NRRL F-5123 TaxID=1463856 RepID=UPI0004E24E3A|nr:right-handed parallel beta-helix repeat-containing protein [Streptomyces sp. NRRL F-5123]